jgi:hypothetical protein
MSTTPSQQWGLWGSESCDQLWQDRHIRPIGDAIEHTWTRLCWCQPIVEECGYYRQALVIHRSADGRELKDDNYNPEHPAATRH